MFRDESTQYSHREFELMQKRITRLKSLALKYKRAEVTQNMLLELSNLAAEVSSPSEFYSQVHRSLNILLPADNFFVALLNQQNNVLEVPFFLDEKDDHPIKLFSKESISEKLFSGLTGYVLKTGKYLLCDQDKFDQLILDKEIESLGAPCHQWLGTPIKINHSVVGVLVIQSYSKNISFTEMDIELLSFVSHQISNIMARLQHQEQLEQAIAQRTKELSVAYDKLKQEVNERRRAEQLQKSLFEIADLSTSNIDTHTFYSELHRVISHLIPVSNCYIALLNEQCTMIHFPFYVSQAKGPEPSTRNISDGLTEYVIKHRKPLLLQRSDIQALVNAGEIYSKMPEIDNTKDIHQWIGIPLFIREQVRGALTIYSTSKTRKYQENDLDLLTFVSQHIGNAIERKLSAESLISSYEQLEEKVVERTQALALLNQDLEKEITQRRKVERQLTHDANHDSLTGLPSRAMFMERLAQAVKHTRRHTLDRFALLFIDLDRFKLINDTLGHLEGDRFLVETSRRLKLCIRDNDTLGRIGGDEFVILLDRINGSHDAEEVAERVLTGLSEPYKLTNQQFKSGASIGIAFSNNKADTSESLLRDADAAMYQAKSNGKGCYVTFDDKSHKQLDKDIELEQELQNAISNRSLLISYLPIQELSTGEILALEPRLYWNHPCLGKIKQTKLFNIAEHCNLTTELDIFLLESLNDEYSGLRKRTLDHLPLHLNISGQHLKHKHALRQLKNKLKQSHFNRQQIWLFFDEQGFIFDTDNHICAFEQLTKLDVNLALSGYGSAHSALSSLTFLPLQGLKLDPSYANHLDSEQHTKLLNAHFLAAQALELNVFVDGISTTNQKTAMQKIGFEQGQGQALGEVIHLREISELVCA
ncbi:diguanylate cyclase [Shewanella sp. D64]|uniref:sensor domain-containing diguanylate cyclase n=1 Tax=unclassified Shewanella TaxID=196818 RepID=UPI0022BA17D3|nr:MULTISPECIES: diguanylate cyclase [unclassified Shewanella]MEC4727366.1 diguanylate cyclase [Shewanella sp. D64]MEC4739521.1 diguanylate cyclase [Shewanella sp. E94]WBJ96095.1 diguanylate cyclase [Shewanella sp. MTB7]